MISNFKILKSLRAKWESDSEAMDCINGNFLDWRSAFATIRRTIFNICTLLPLFYYIILKDIYIYIYIVYEQQSCAKYKEILGN